MVDIDSMTPIGLYTNELKSYFEYVDGVTEIFGRYKSYRY